jgi:hypothetical protein
MLFQSKIVNHRRYGPPFPAGGTVALLSNSNRTVFVSPDGTSQVSVVLTVLE